MRAELSRKNKYWISRHRQYELKHFCLQYDEWKKLVLSIGFTSSINKHSLNKHKYYCSPTEKYAELRESYLRNISIIEKTANVTDEVIGPYILDAVTKGLNYEYLQTFKGIPCGRTTYYKLYRKFFHLLDIARK